MTIQILADRVAPEVGNVTKLESEPLPMRDGASHAIPAFARSTGRAFFPQGQYRRREKDMPFHLPAVNAESILEAGAQHMRDRATTYDAPGGERSMEKTVAMFNALTGHGLTETEGWHFMQILKMVRASQGDYRADNFEDGAAYAALAGESAARQESGP